MPGISAHAAVRLADQDVLENRLCAADLAGPILPQGLPTAEHHVRREAMERCLEGHERHVPEQQLQISLSCVGFRQGLGLVQSIVCLSPERIST